MGVILLKKKEWDIKDVAKNGLKYYLNFKPSDFPKGLYIQKKDFFNVLKDGDLVFFPHLPEMGVCKFTYRKRPFIGLYRGYCIMDIPSSVNSIIRIPEGLIDFKKDWEDYELTWPHEFPSYWSWYCFSNCPPFPMLDEDLYNEIIDDYYNNDKEEN